MVAPRTSSSALQAVIFDVDGTLAETERDGHRVAFNRAFEALGLPWRWDVARYGQLLAITGGRERLMHDLSSHPDAPRLEAERDALVREIHSRKNAFYGEIVEGGAISLRPGVRELLKECHERGALLGIATTTSRSNVEALLRASLGADWESWFSAVVCGEAVAAKKPDPEVYMIALRSMGLSPLDCLAIEDSPAGVIAARAAGIPVLVTRSAYFANDAIDAAVAIGPGLHSREGWNRPPIARPGVARITLDDLAEWHRRMDTR